MSDSILVDATELARLLGQGKSSIYRMAQSGVIPCYAAGPKQSGLRFDPVEVRAALRRHGMTNQRRHEDGPTR